MPKYLIDSSFGETIKTARVQNNIPAKVLAEHINKSPAYITKLEHGDIKSIDIDTFNSILSCIFGNAKDQNEIVNKLYESLNIKYTNTEIEKALWFQNFSTVSCRIPISKELIEYINGLINSNDISREYLLLRINSNESLSDEEKQDKSIEENQWYIDKSDNKSQCIKLNLKESYFNSILDCKKNKAPYVYILSILYYINKIIKYNETIKISTDENKKLMHETIDTLNQFKFYSITEKEKALYNNKTNDDISNILNSFDIENKELINHIISALQIYSDIDVKQINEYLIEYNNTINWDLGFAVRILGLPFSKMDKVSFSSKKKLLNEIEQLIDKYSSTDDLIDKIEVY